MNEIVKYPATALTSLMIVCCIARQVRYCREISTNKPSGSVRAGYTAAFLAIAGGLIYAACSNNDSSWEIFVSVVTVAFLFCLKVTFSPSMIALTLAICTFQLHTSDSFPLMEVWSSLISIITWRFPDAIRASYAYVSFIWIVISVLFPARAVAGAADTLLDTADSSLDHVGPLLNA